MKPLQLSWNIMIVTEQKQKKFISDSRSGQHLAMGTRLSSVILINFGDLLHTKLNLILGHAAVMKRYSIRGDI